MDPFNRSDRGDNEDALSIAGSDSLALSYISRPSAVEDVDPQEPEVSEDEGLPPDQPAFTGLFPQALFKSLLFKAVNTAQLGTSAQPDPPAVPGSLNPLFAEPPKPVTAISTPPLFLDVIRKQWSSPVSAPVPSAMDHKNFTVSQDLTSLLQVPTIDTPVAALLSNALIPGDPEESIRPEERRSEQVLQRAHQGAAWAIRSVTTASIFNRLTLLWLRQLQDKLSPEDTRLKQDINKIIAAVQFSADATLKAAHFASKSLASSIEARHLVWLRHWQTDARHKWRLASVPFMGNKLFEDPLESFLVETKDKRKILPTVFHRGESHYSPYTP